MSTSLEPIPKNAASDPNVVPLGTASTLMELRREFEDRCQLTGRQLRIEKIVYTGKEGKTSQGCPVAKWVIRRADPEEKILVVVKKRPGHR